MSQFTSTAFFTLTAPPSQRTVLPSAADWQPKKLAETVMSLRNVAAAIALVSTLAACAGRDPRPVATSMASDAGLNCSAIHTEIAANSSKITETEQERRTNRNNNLALGVAGALFLWPALLALDVGNHEEVEINALQARNNHLNMIAAQQGCFIKVAQG